MKRREIMSKLTKGILTFLITAFTLFAVSFTVYFFNLDMKLTAAIEPFLNKHYDTMPRKRYI